MDPGRLSGFPRHRPGALRRRARTPRLPGRRSPHSTLGSFVESMGLETLLESVRFLRTNGPDIRIVMVGAGAEKVRLRRHAARLGLDNLEMS